MPAYTVKVENDRVFVDLQSGTKRHQKKPPSHPLSRPVVREEGVICIAGISTTVMNPQHPRYSTSDALLETALAYAKTSLQVETQSIKLRDLQFRSCEGF